MAINTMVDIFKSPLGTARLLEGYSALSRAKQAQLSNDQIRTIYTDLAGVSDADINGFVNLGSKFISGEARCRRTAFPKPGKPATES